MNEKPPKVHYFAGCSFPPWKIDASKDVMITIKDAKVQLDITIIIIIIIILIIIIIIIIIILKLFLYDYYYLTIRNNLSYQW